MSSSRSPAYSGRPLRWAYMSRSVTLAVTYGSDMANDGSRSTMRSSHVITLSPTSPASTVDDSGLDSDASWNTVSASTGSGLPTSRTP